jgi:hypothetical protein
VDGVVPAATGALGDVTSVTTPASAASTLGGVTGGLANTLSLPGVTS